MAQRPPVLIRVKRTDPLVVALANRHYSRARASSAVGSPARSLILRDSAGTIAVVWTWPRDGYRRDGQNGANCELFRNESTLLSSEILREAEVWVHKEWPAVRRLFTYVDPARVRSSNPGYCFLMAGWRHDGWSASGKRRIVKTEN